MSCCTCACRVALPMCTSLCVCECLLQSFSFFVSLPSPLVSPSFPSSPRTFVFGVCVRGCGCVPCGFCGSWWGVMDTCCPPFLRTCAVPRPPRLSAGVRLAVRAWSTWDPRLLPHPLQSLTAPLGWATLSGVRCGGPAPGRATRVDPPGGMKLTNVFCDASAGGRGACRAPPRRGPVHGVTTPALTWVCTRRLSVRRAPSQTPSLAVGWWGGGGLRLAGRHAPCAQSTQTRRSTMALALFGTDGGLTHKGAWGCGHRVPQGRRSAAHPLPTLSVTGTPSVSRRRPPDWQYGRWAQRGRPRRPPLCLPSSANM